MGADQSSPKSSSITGGDAGAYSADLTDAAEFLLDVHNRVFGVNVRSSQMIDCAMEMLGRFYAQHTVGLGGQRCIAMAAYRLAVDTGLGARGDLDMGILDDEETRACGDGFEGLREGETARDALRRVVGDRYCQYVLHKHLDDDGGDDGIAFSGRYKQHKNAVKAFHRALDRVRDDFRAVPAEMMRRGAPGYEAVMNIRRGMAPDVAVDGYIDAIASP